MHLVMSAMKASAFKFYLNGILLAFKRRTASTAPGITLLSMWIVPLRSISTPLIDMVYFGVLRLIDCKKINSISKHGKIKIARHSDTYFDSTMSWPLNLPFQANDPFELSHHNTHISTSFFSVIVVALSHTRVHT